MIVLDLADVLVGMEEKCSRVTTKNNCKHDDVR